MILKEGILLTRMAANAIAPGVISDSPHFVPAGVGPGRDVFCPSSSDDGPNKSTFNTYHLSVGIITKVW